MLENLTLAFSSFTAVFLLVFQQQNVIHRKYLWAAFTSIGITLAQVMVIKGVAGHNSIANILFLATGGVTGVLSSMFVHQRLVDWYAAVAKRAGKGGLQGEMATESSTTSSE